MNKEAKEFIRRLKEIGYNRIGKLEWISVSIEELDNLVKEVFK